MHNLRANFSKFLAIAKTVFRDEIDVEGNFKFYPNKPKMSDIQVIALSCLAESLSIDCCGGPLGELVVRKASRWVSQNVSQPDSQDNV